MSERECRGRAQTLPLAMVVLILAVQTANRCRFSSTPQAEAIATSATTVQCLHALLGAVVVSGAWRDFLPSCLVVVFALGAVEQRVHKLQIEGAALTWCFG